MPTVFLSLEEEIGGALIKELTPDSFVICISRMPALAFKKAYEKKSMAEIKHFEAQ